MDNSFIRCWCEVHKTPQGLQSPLLQSRMKADFEFCQKENISWMDINHPLFPPLLKDSTTSSLKAFFYMGNVSGLSLESVSVVGSRNPSSMSLKWMDDYFLEFLEKNPLIVVSGGAYGVDQKAHACALQAKLPTIAFLPSGFKDIYPKTFKNWVKPILDSQGGLISAFPLDSQAHRFHFHTRNKWIAQCSLFTFMVEGRKRSGSSITLKHAFSLGKKVCSLPQSPYSSAQAFMDVLDMGGYLVRDAVDLKLIYDKARSKQTVF